MSTVESEIPSEVSPAKNDVSSSKGIEINMSGDHKLSMATSELNLAQNAEQATVLDNSVKNSEKSESRFMKRLESIAVEHDKSRPGESALKATNAWNSLFHPTGFRAEIERPLENLDITETDIYKAKK